MTDTMKSSSLLIPCFTLALMTPMWSQDDCCGQSVQVGRKVFRDAATHEQLSSQSAENADPMSGLDEVVRIESSADAELMQAPTSLRERCEVLSYNGVSTYVPKRALLHVPEGWRKVLEADTTAKLVPWDEFLRRNHAWIHVVEVKSAQAEGREPLSETLVESFADRQAIVVSVFHGGPISVMPLRDEIAVSESSNTNTQ